MIDKLDKIVVVGGGSAGWMSAAFLKKAFPQREIIVIESPNVPTVGVGESTLGGINTYLRFLELDEVEFMRSTNAAYKMGIKFTDFYKKGDGGFHFPFGTPYENGVPIDTWLVKKAMQPETPIEDFVRCFHPTFSLIESGKFDLNDHGIYDSYEPETDVAYQFDAIKFAHYLRESYCKKIGVHHIPATVIDVKTNDDGIESLTLDSGEIITADLYIDCTGFKAMLLGEALGEEFVSYEELVPNNRSWAAQVPYKNKEIELESYTNCTALGNGWVWNTPIWNRIGTGYVYSDKFVTPERALEEFKEYLMSDKMVIPRTKEEIDQINFRDVSFKTGHFEKIFVKNVVAIGLSAGFIEPLESNGLLTIHEFLFRLQKVIQREGVNQIEKDVFNLETCRFWQGFCRFVAMHYLLSLRNDTPYWKHYRKKSINNDKWVQHILDNQLHSNTFGSSFRAWRPNSPPIEGLNWVSIGMNYFYFNWIDLQLIENTPNTKHHLEHYIHGINELEIRKNKWNEAAKNAPSMLEYHLKNIYFDENKL